MFIIILSLSHYEGAAQHILLFFFHFSLKLVFFYIITHPHYLLPLTTIFIVLFTFDYDVIMIRLVEL